MYIACTRCCTNGLPVEHVSVTCHVCSDSYRNGRSCVYSLLNGRQDKNRVLGRLTIRRPIMHRALPTTTTTERHQFSPGHRFAEKVDGMEIVMVTVGGHVFQFNCVSDAFRQCHVTTPTDTHSQLAVRVLYLRRM